ncbi:hypothetical protein PQR46_01495 [Paraburkholderia sediminicola]
MGWRLSRDVRYVMGLALGHTFRLCMQGIVLDDFIDYVSQNLQI